MGTIISITPVSKKIKPDDLDLLAGKAWALKVSAKEKSLRLSRELLKLSIESLYEKGKGLAYRNISFNKLIDEDIAGSIIEAQRARAVFTVIKFEKGIADCFYILGMCECKKKSFSEALQNFTKAYENYLSHNDLLSLCHTLDCIGYTYFQMGFIERALFYFTHANEQLEQVKDADFIKADLLYHMGLVSAQLNQHEQAANYFNEGNKLYRRLHHSKGEANSLQSLGELKLADSQYKEALNYLTKGYKLFKSLGHPDGISHSCFNLGKANMGAGRNKEAGVWLQKATLLFEKTGNRRKFIETECQLALLRLKQKQFSVTEKLLSKQLSRAIELNDKGLEALPHELLSDYFNGVKQYEKSIYHSGLAMKCYKEADMIRKGLYAQHGEIVLETEKRLRQLTENKVHDQYHVKKNKTLNELMQVKKDILRHASHDLKSPLNSIKGLVNLLSNSYNTRRQIKEYTDLIEEAADQMLKLVNDIQHAAIVESGFIECKPVLFDLAGLAKLCANSFLVQAHEKNQNITVRASKPYYVYADKEKISSVLNNLISNASKFSYLNQNITITFSTVKNVTRCCIKDEGQGLSRTDLQDAFQQFKRLSARPTGSEDSIGLGLFICKKQMEVNNGKIWAESEGKNKGSRFIFELPNRIEMNEN